MDLIEVLMLVQFSRYTRNLAFFLVALAPSVSYGSPCLESLGRLFSPGPANDRAAVGLFATPEGTETKSISPVAYVEEDGLRREYRAALETVNPETRKRAADNLISQFEPEAAGELRDVFNQNPLDLLSVAAAHLSTPNQELNRACLEVVNSADKAIAGKLERKFAEDDAFLKREAADEKASGKSEQEIFDKSDQVTLVGTGAMAYFAERLVKALKGSLWNAEANLRVVTSEDAGTFEIQKSRGQVVQTDALRATVLSKIGDRLRRTSAKSILNLPLIGAQLAAGLVANTSARWKKGAVTSYEFAKDGSITMGLADGTSSRQRTIFENSGLGASRGPNGSDPATQFQSNTKPLVDAMLAKGKALNAKDGGPTGTSEKQPFVINIQAAPSGGVVYSVMMIVAKVISTHATGNGKLSWVGGEYVLSDLRAALRDGVVINFIGGYSKVGSDKKIFDSLAYSEADLITITVDHPGKLSAGNDNEVFSKANLPKLGVHFAIGPPVPAKFRNKAGDDGLSAITGEDGRFAASGKIFDFERDKERITSQDGSLTITNNETGEVRKIPNDYFLSAAGQTNNPAADRLLSLLAKPLPDGISLRTKLVEDEIGAYALLVQSLDCNQNVVGTMGYLFPTVKGIIDAITPSQEKDFNERQKLVVSAMREMMKTLPKQQAKRPVNFIRRPIVFDGTDTHISNAIDPIAGLQDDGAEKGPVPGFYSAMSGRIPPAPLDAKTGKPILSSPQKK